MRRWGRGLGGARSGVRRRRCRPRWLAMCSRPRRCGGGGDGEAAGRCGHGRRGGCSLAEAGRARHGVVAVASLSGPWRARCWSACPAGRCGLGQDRGVTSASVPSLRELWPYAETPLRRTRQIVGDGRGADLVCVVVANRERVRDRVLGLQGAGSGPNRRAPGSANACVRRATPWTGCPCWAASWPRRCGRRGLRATIWPMSGRGGPPRRGPPAGCAAPARVCRCWVCGPLRRRHSARWAGRCTPTRVGAGWTSTPWRSLVPSSWTDWVCGALQGHESPEAAYPQSGGADPRSPPSPPRWVPRSGAMVGETGVGREWTYCLMRHPP